MPSAEHMASPELVQQSAAPAAQVMPQRLDTPVAKSEMPLAVPTAPQGSAADAQPNVVEQQAKRQVVSNRPEAGSAYRIWSYADGQPGEPSFNEIEAAVAANDALSTTIKLEAKRFFFNPEKEGEALDAVEPSVEQEPDVYAMDEEGEEQVEAGMPAAEKALQKMASEPAITFRTWPMPETILTEFELEEGPSHANQVETVAAEGESAVHPSAAAADSPLARLLPVLSFAVVMSHD